MPEKVSPIGVGVVGCGYWGPNLIRNFHASPRARLVAACDSREGRAERALRSYPSAKPLNSLEAMLDDPRIDLVAVATPVGAHYAIARKAILAGKSVLLEKPMTASCEQADELLALATERNKSIFVDHTFLFTPAVRKIKELHDAGELGDIQFIDSVRINLGLFQHDVNVVWDLAPHDLAIATRVLGRLPNSVQATGASHSPSGLEDVAYVHLDYGGGLIAHFHVNWLSPVKVRQVIIGGTRRSLIWNDLDPLFKLNVYDRGVDLTMKSAATETGAAEIQEALVSYRTGDMHSPNLPQQEALAAEVEHIAQCVSEGRRSDICDGAHGRAVVRLLEAAQASIRAGGRRVELGEQGEFSAPGGRPFLGASTRPAGAESPEAAARTAK
jgi:predicted dehydrogenase